MLGKNLQEMVIYSKDMVKLGRVDDLEIDTERMKITHLILKLEDQVAKEIFGKSPKIRQAKGRVSTDLVESARDAIVLKMQNKKLKGAIESL